MDYNRIYIRGSLGPTCLTLWQVPCRLIAVHGEQKDNYQARGGGQAEQKPRLSVKFSCCRHGIIINILSTICTFGMHSYAVSF